MDLFHRVIPTYICFINSWYNEKEDCCSDGWGFA